MHCLGARLCEPQQATEPQLQKFTRKDPKTQRGMGRGKVDALMRKILRACHSNAHSFSRKPFFAFLAAWRATSDRIIS